MNGTVIPSTSRHSGDYSHGSNSFFVRFFLFPRYILNSLTFPTQTSTFLSTFISLTFLYLYVCRFNIPSVFSRGIFLSLSLSAPLSAPFFSLSLPLKICTVFYSYIQRNREKPVARTRQCSFLASSLSLPFSLSLGLYS